MWRFAIESWSLVSKVQKDEEGRMIGVACNTKEYTVSSYYSVLRKVQKELSSPWYSIW